MAWEVSADQVEQWILQSNLPGHPQQSSSMQSLLQMEPPHASLLWELLTKPQANEIVIFYALNRLPKDERLRDWLLWNSPAVSSSSSSVAIRNKAASMLASFLIYDGGTQRWNSVGNDLLRLSEIHVELFLQTIILLMDDFHIISTAADASDQYDTTTIEAPTSATSATASVKDTRRWKDYLKGYYNNDTNDTTPALLQQLLQRIVQIPVSTRSITALGRLFRWTTIPNDGIAIELLLQSIMNPDLCKDALDALHHWCETLFEQHEHIPPSHLPLLERLLSILHTTQLFTHHTAIKIQAADDVETVEIVIAIAQLCNTIGMRLPTLELFFCCWAYDDIDVTLQVVPLARTMTRRMNETNDATLMPYLERFLSILYEQIKYPEDFTFDFGDDEDSEEQAFRLEMYNVYETLVQNAPQRTLQYVFAAASALLSNDVSTMPFSTVEATLRLIHHYSDGLRGIASASILSNPDFCQLLQQLHCSNITRHYHPEVLLLYYELTLRYHAMFSKLPQLLSTVLDALSGTFGIQHAHARVRSRCCYILLRLVKHTVNLLRDFAETAIVGICRLVEGHSAELTEDDKLHLFETVGILIGKTKMDGAQQRHHLQAIITPHIRHIEHLLAQQYEPETFILHASNAIAVIAFLSKGFTRPPVEVQSLFAEILPYSLQVLGTMPQAEMIRNKTMILQQRMILMVGKATIPTGRHFLRLLITNCTNDDLLLVAQLMNQYAKFKEDAGLVLESELIPFIQRCDALARSESLEDDNDDDNVGSANTGCLSHTAVEELRVRKLAYTVVQTIVCQQATAVLVSEGNVAHLPFLLETMCNGAVFASDPLVQRTCLKFFKDIAMQFNGSCNMISNDVKLMVLTFICQTVVPKALEMLSGLGSKLLKDATTARLIQEVAEILTILRSQVQLQHILEQVEAWPSASLLRPLLTRDNNASTISSHLEAQLKSKTSWNGE